MQKLKSVLTGWFMFLLVDLKIVTDPDIVKPAMARYDICKQCEFKLIGFCKKCWCFTKAKVFVQNETCPKNYWK